MISSFACRRASPVSRYCFSQSAFTWDQHGGRAQLWKVLRKCLRVFFVLRRAPQGFPGQPHQEA